MKVSSFSKVEVKTSGAREANKVNATVQAGETKVAEVARRIGVSVEALVKANPQIKDQNALKAGQDIRLPANRPQTAPLPARPPQDGGASSTTAPRDPLAKAMAQAKLNQKASQTLELEPLQIVVDRRHTEFSDAYDHLFGNDAGKTEEKPPEPAAPSEQDKQITERLETLNRAVNGDIAALAKIRALPDVGLLDLEKMLEILGFDWATLQTLVPDKVGRAAELSRESLSGNEKAWVELQKEWTGREPSVEAREAHAKDPLGNWFRAERSFELWGLPTRPQEHLDRGRVLQDALVRAQKGDLSGLAKLGIETSKVIPNHADGLIPLLSPGHVTASPEVMIPGVGPVGSKPAAGDSTGITPLIQDAENTIQKALTLDPARLKDIGLDRQFLRDLLALFGGWEARGEGGKAPTNSGGGPSSGTPGPSNTTTAGAGVGSAHNRFGFTDSKGGAGASVGTSHDSTWTGGAASGGPASSEGGAAQSGAAGTGHDTFGSGGAATGAPATSQGGAAQSGVAGTGHDASGSGGAATGGAAAEQSGTAMSSFGTKPPANALPGTAWSPDGEHISVKWWNGETLQFKNIEEYRAWRDQEAAKSQPAPAAEPAETAEPDSTTETDASSTEATEETTDSDATTESESASADAPPSDDSESDSDYRDNDAGGYSNTTGTYEKLRLSGDPVPTNDGSAYSDLIEQPRIDAGTTPNVDPDYLEPSATMTKATAPIDFHRDGAIQGPPPDRDDPSTQERR